MISVHLWRYLYIGAGAIFGIVNPSKEKKVKKQSEGNMKCKVKRTTRIKVGEQIKRE